MAKLPALMASQKHISYKLRIALGTGDMAGDWFGPIKQFQVVGKAMTTADRLIRTPPILDSTVQMSQYTYNLICPHEGIKETGSIGRDNLEDLKVFTYAPENSPGQGTAKTPRSTFSSTLRGAAARFFKR